MCCRAGQLRRGRPRGADGGPGPGGRACLGRRCHLRRPTVAWRGGYRLCGFPVSTILRRRQATRHRRRALALAGHCPCRSRGSTRLRLPGELTRACPAWTRRYPQGPGRARVRCRMGSVFGGRGGCAARTATALPAGRRRMRAGRSGSIAAHRRERPRGQRWDWPRGCGRPRTRRMGDGHCRRVRRRRA